MDKSDKVELFEELIKIVKYVRKIKNEYKIPQSNIIYITLVATEKMYKIILDNKEWMCRMGKFNIDKIWYDCSYSIYLNVGEIK